MYLSLKRDGLNLHGRLDAPELKSFPVAILFHGFGGSIEDYPESIFSRIAKSLVDKGIGVMRFDFNGHGKSEGTFTNMNIFNEINDAIAILEYAKKQSYTKNIYLIGHSQGGVVAGMTAGLYPEIVEKLVLLAPAASLKTDAQQGKCFHNRYDTNNIPTSINVDGVHNVGGHYFRIAKNLPIYEITKNFTNPALAICGLKDTVVSKKSIEQYKKELNNCHVEYMDVDHGLNGKETDNMIDLIGEFLSEDVPSPKPEEVFSIDIKINHTEEVISSPVSARIVSFTGFCNSPLFKGEIVHDGADTQIITEGITSLSARYILKGTDFTGAPCSMFIENNAASLSDGEIITTPKILTDSPALKYLEEAKLTGTVIPADGGIKVIINKLL